MAKFSAWRKSTRSNNSNNSDCVECRRAWRKSTRSNNTADNDCVEARHLGPGFQVRDSKLGDHSPTFDLAAGDFAALLTAAK